MITDESMTARPSCSSDGTTPFGLIARYSGLSWSPANRSSLRSSKVRPLACSTKRTRWLQVDCGALNNTSSVMRFSAPLRRSGRTGSCAYSSVDARRGVDRLGLLVGLHRRGPRPDRLEPALEVGEVLELLALPLVRHDPRIARHVGDRIVAGDEVAVGQPLVEHAVEAVRPRCGSARSRRRSSPARSCVKWLFWPAIGPSPPICQNSHCSVS